MKVRTSELTGAALDWAVAKAEGHAQAALTNNPFGFKHCMKLLPHYSTDWSQGGPILTNARISRTIDHSGLWIAYNGDNYADSKEHMQCHSSELVAGLRCFVASKLGDEVDVPEELLK